ncbi:hypothetical protein PR202_ga03425 [Eleusine coracana subsp. coracana]|uniref:Uncharacterized protein n=1 Tax=Eleusine coracana subsp. coracana TaxID=191504 RepID=A0AAV5BPE8_ELECO|nr:hypothetical protein PR202_ga03425 [Eleusine coracana subsp. coracana]
MQASSHYSFPSFPVREPPKILDGEGVATQKLIPRHMRNGGSLLDGHITAAVPVVDFSARLQHNDHAMDHRVSFELTVEDVARCLEKKTAISGDSTSASFRLAPISNGDHPRESVDTMAGLHTLMKHTMTCLRKQGAPCPFAWPKNSISTTLMLLMWKQVWDLTGGRMRKLLGSQQSQKRTGPSSQWRSRESANLCTDHYHTR